MNYLERGSVAQLKGEADQDFTAPFRSEIIAAILSSSSDALLAPLLVSTDPEVVLLALQTLASRTRSHHLVHDEQTTMMVRELSRGWPPLDLLSWVSGAGEPPTSLQFEYFDGKPRVIHLASEGLLGEDCLFVFNRLVREFGVPDKSRFGLLTRIRFARAFHQSTESRHAYVRVMILAMQLRWDRTLMMPRQLRRLARSGNERIPENIRLLALETLTVHGETPVFSPAEMQRRVDSFLSRKGRCSAAFLEAMLNNSSSTLVTVNVRQDPRQLPGFIVSSADAEYVLSWLEREVKSLQEGGRILIESLLLSRALRAVETESHSARLKSCLVTLFRNARTFGCSAFNLAARLVPPGTAGELGSAFVEAMLAVAIPLGWQITDAAAIAYFVSRMTPESEAGAVELILNKGVPRGMFLLGHARIMSLLLEAGGYEFLSRLPAQELPGNMIVDVGDGVCDDIARSFSLELERCGGNPDGDLLHRLDWTLGVTARGAFLGRLSAHGAVDNLVAAFHSLAEGSPLLGVCSSIFKRIAESDGRLVVDKFSRLLGSGSDVDGMSHSIIHAASKLDAPAQSLILDEACRSKEFNLILASCKALESLPPASTSARGLLMVMNHVLDMQHDNLFASRVESRGPELEQLRSSALAWYRTSLFSCSIPCSNYAGELLRLGEILTRDQQLAKELLRACHLPQLVDKLLEIAADDPSRTGYATLMVVHLLEDDDALYRSMAHKIRTYMTEDDDVDKDAGCGVEQFVTGLSSLALRHPQAFVRASSDICEFCWETEVGTVVRLNQHQRPGINKADDHESFARLLDHLLGRLDDAAVHLLTRILEELPGTGMVQSVIDANVLERVFESSWVSDARVFPEFLNSIDRLDEWRAISQAMLNVFSSPGLDSIKMSNICKRLPHSWEYLNAAAVEWMLDRLDLLLDLDHADAELAAASVFQVLLSVLRNDLPVEIPVQTFQGPRVSDASINSFCGLVRQQQEQSCLTGYDCCTLPREEEAEEEDEDEDWKAWQLRSGHLETLVKFFRFAPLTLPRTELQDFLAYLLQTYTRDQAFVAKLLLDDEKNEGVPVHVLKHLVLFYSKVIKRHGCCFEQDTGILLVQLLVGALKLSALSRVALVIMETILRWLKRHEKTYSIRLSDDQVRSLCHLAVHSGHRMSDVLVELVTLDPSLRGEFVSAMVVESTEVAASALESLRRRDYSCGEMVARLALVFERVVGQDHHHVEAREHLAQALEPLWGFIHGTKRIGKAKPLIQALFIAQALGSTAAPSAFSTDLLQSIARDHAPLVKLAAPMLLRWPSLASLGFSTKLAFLRGSFVASTARQVRICVRRDNILGDSYNKFGQLTPQVLRSSGSISVQFEGEAGRDNGGLTREWYQNLSCAIATELFTESGNPRLPHARKAYDLSYFSFAGRLVAKAIVDDQRLGVRFAPSFYKHMLGQPVTYLDMEDAEHLSSLNWLLENRVDESMGLTFSVDVEHCAEGYELIAGGSTVPVTDANKHEYVNMLGGYLLTESFRPEMEAFLDGFYELVPKDVISVFHPDELELVICGLPEINVAELKAVAKCRHDHPHILKWFWDTVAAFDDPCKSLLLKFVTGSSKVPFGGVKDFCVGFMDGGESYLPTSRTCTNEILLPSYETQKQLKDKLLLAIFHGSDSFQFV